MDGGVSLCLQLLNLPVRKRLALVLIIFAVSLCCYELSFPSAYFGCLLLLPLLCTAWLFGWRGGLLCLAGLAMALGVRHGLTLESTIWHTTSLIFLIIEILFALPLCLTVGALHHVSHVLLDERQNTARLQRAYQQEHALNEWKDRAIQDLNHELRIPLTQTEGYLELLETYRDNLDAVTQARFITLARSGCEELLNLTRTTMATIQESGKQHSPNLSVFSLQHEVQTALAQCQPCLLQEHQIELEIPQSLLVYADAGFVRQVIRNLLMNAYKYTPTQSPITVTATTISATDSTHGQACMICVRVRDYGPGIPPEQQNLLFQRFVRLPNAITSTQPGSGLGLAICKQLVEAMGGAIWIESTGKDGEGCCFSFTLVSGAAPGADEQAEHRGENHDESKTISRRQQCAASPAWRRS